MANVQMFKDDICYLTLLFGYLLNGKNAHHDVLAVEIKTGQLTVEAVQECHALHTDDHVTCTAVLMPAVLRTRIRDPK
jgi:hypothetical protein